MNSVHRAVAYILASMLLSGLSWGQQSPASTTKQDAGNSNAKKTEKATKVESSEFIFRMSNYKLLRGVPMELALIDVDVMGAEMSIPLDSISGIRFAASEDETETIALLDGEIINGKVDVPELRLAVEWGEAKLNRDVVKSLVRNVDMFWQLKNTPNGSKWFLGPRYYRWNSSNTGTWKRETIATPSPVAFPVNSGAAAERSATRFVSHAASHATTSSIEPINPNPPAMAVYDFVYPELNPQDFAWIW